MKPASVKGPSHKGCLWSTELTDRHTQDPIYIVVRKDTPPQFIMNQCHRY